MIFAKHLKNMINTYNIYKNLRKVTFPTLELSCLILGMKSFLVDILNTRFEIFKIFVDKE